MSEGVSRTFIGSVVCVDLVGYSKRSVEQQIAVKDAFNRLLARALEPIAEEDRIILDTGDGAAISFLGDPEQGLAVGLALRDAMRDNASALGATDAGSAMRMGINLGPVKLAVDLNGYPKIIGDGLNVAERIMGFAQPGQIAVSRSFVEMVSRLNDRNAKLFRFEGAKTDKNAREHQVYVVEPGARLGKGGPGAATAAAEGSSALVGFLEDNVKVGVAAAILVLLIAGEGYLLARKARANVPPVAAAESPRPAPVKSEPPKAEPPKPAAKTEKPEPPKATAKADPVPAKPEPKAEPKTEPRPEPPKADTKPVRKDDARPAAEAVSPVQPNLVSIAPLNFPSEAAARGYTTGSVKARLTIDAAGNVTRVQILSAQPARGFFDEEATRSLRDWKFDRGPANRQYVADIKFDQPRK